MDAWRHNNVHSMHSPFQTPPMTTADGSNAVRPWVQNIVAYVAWADISWRVASFKRDEIDEMFLFRFSTDVFRAKKNTHNLLKW